MPGWLFITGVVIQNFISPGWRYIPASISTWKTERKKMSSGFGKKDDFNLELLKFSRPNVGLPFYFYVAMRNRLAKNII